MNREGMRNSVQVLSAGVSTQGLLLFLMFSDQHLERLKKKKQHWAGKFLKDLGVERIMDIPERLGITIPS